MSNLPKPKKNAANIAGITLALATDAFAYSLGLPIGGVIYAAFQTTLAMRKERATAVLLAELGQGDIDLNDEDYQYLIPNALKFYQKARDGENEKTLGILAQIIANGCKKEFGNPINDSEFIQQCEAISNLGHRDFCLLEILNRGGEVVIGNADMPHGTGVVGGPFQAHEKDIAAIFDSKEHQKESISRLIGRGLLNFEPKAAWGGGWVDYTTTPLYSLVRRRALDKIKEMTESNAPYPN